MRFVFGLAALVALVFAAGSLSDDTAPPVPDGPLVELPPVRERSDLQAVLINPASGETVHLSQPGRKLALHDFSPDGRWLVYTSFPEPPDVGQSNLYRIDLQPADPRPELLTPGSWPTYSSQGQLAFVHWRDNVARTFVLSTDGVIREMQSPGFPTSWSPDGRWLTYSERYKRETGDGADLSMAQVIVDTATWQEREYARSVSCGCDSNPWPHWAPDSTRFLHTTLGGSSVSERTYVTSIYYPAWEDASTPAPGGHFWLDANRYVAGQRASNGLGRAVYLVDATSGLRTEQPGGDPNDEPYYWSPNRTKFVTGNGVTSKIFDARTGLPISGVVWGWPREWSSDGRFLLTQANQTDCGPAVMVHRAADGEYLYCGANSEIGAFSPDAAALAYLRTNSREPHSIAVSDVYLMNLADGSERLLLRDVRGYLCVSWSPDGRWLLVSVCGGGV